MKCGLRELDKEDGRTKRLTGLFSLKAPPPLSSPPSLKESFFPVEVVVAFADLLAAAAAAAAASVGFPSISRSQRLKLRIPRHSR